MAEGAGATRWKGLTRRPARRKGAAFLGATVALWVGVAASALAAEGVAGRGGGTGWLAPLRDSLRDEVLGDAVLEPAWTPGLVVFVMLEPPTLPGRAQRDLVDIELVRRQPASAVYYLWRAMGRAWEQGLEFRKAVLVVPGEVQVQAVWEASAAGGRAAAASPTAAGERAGAASFDPAAAVAEIQVWVDGQLWRHQPGQWAQAADLLVSNGDRWLGRYRAYGSLGPLPDTSPLLRAQRLYQAALELYPGHPAAREQLAAVEERLQAVSLFARAQRLVDEHERALREAERRHDDLAITRHSFYLWKALELLEQSLELDRTLLGASAALERLRRVLGDRPRPAYETAAQLEAELRESYIRQSTELDYEQARRAGEALRGSRVHLRGQVVRWVDGRSPTGTALVVAWMAPAASNSGSAGSAGASSPPESAQPGGREGGLGARALRPLVYVQLPRGFGQADSPGSGEAEGEKARAGPGLREPFPRPPSAQGAGRPSAAAAPSAAPTRWAEGTVVDVWGELAGHYRYRDPVTGRVSTVLRVMAAYIEPASS